MGGWGGTMFCHVFTTPHHPSPPLLCPLLALQENGCQWTTELARECGKCVLRALMVGLHQPPMRGQHQGATSHSNGQEVHPHVGALGASHPGECTVCLFVEVCTRRTPSLGTYLSCTMWLVVYVCTGQHMHWSHTLACLCPHCSPCPTHACTPASM